MQIIQYVTEEVARQGWDISLSEGWMRVGWMLSAWEYATEKKKVSSLPSVDDLLYIAKMIEPDNNLDGFRHVSVWVGNHTPPDAREIPRLIAQLWSVGILILTPSEFYREFELIHPFIDGNGRTGKIIYNWINSSLYDPILPEGWEQWGFAIP